MKHYTEMVQEPEFAARDKGYTFVSHQQEVGAGYFDDVITVIRGASSKHPYLFVNEATQKPFVTITRAWYRLRAKAGIEKLRVHDLRHSFASFLVNGGRSLYEVQQILGHSDPKVTMRYAHLSTKALQEAANAASVIIKPPVQQAA
jgi:site-specific recombinase XerD